MNELVVIRGLPGSGKSTFAKEEFPNHLHYEPDHLFCDTRGTYRFDSQLWEDACSWIEKMVDNALARGENVVVSDVFPRGQNIRKYHLLATAHDSAFKIFTCENQFKNVHFVPVHIIHKMTSEFESGDYIAQQFPGTPHKTVRV